MKGLEYFEEKIKHVPCMSILTGFYFMYEMIQEVYALLKEAKEKCPDIKN